MSATLRDIRFGGFDWVTDLNGDLRLAMDAEAFRGVVDRWLLTVPAVDEPGLTDEEIETRRLHAGTLERESAYDAPGGDGLTGCLPWEPGWGLGIKRYMGRVLDDATLSEIEARVRTGLPGLAGVDRVLRVSVGAAGDVLTIGWEIATRWGLIGGTTDVQ